MIDEAEGAGRGCLQDVQSYTWMYFTKGLESPSDRAASRVDKILKYNILEM